MTKGLYIGISVLAVGLALVLALMNLEHGNLNQDEGWYLYAAKSVAEGKVPYRDFAFTQGPVLPIVYSGFYCVVERYGVAGGRAMTTILGLCAALLASWAAGRETRENRWAAAIAVFLLVACNVYQSYFTTIVKTYGLCAFLLMAGVVALSFRSRWWGCALAGTFFALAAGTRLSSGIVLPIVGVWLLWQHRALKWSWLWFGLGGGAMLLAVYGPFFLMAPEQSYFGLLGYHAGRESGALMQQAVLKVGFISRFVQAYFLLVILTLSLVCVQFRALRFQRANMVALLWILGGAITLVHFTAPFPYDDYQVIAFPILATALGVSLMQSVKRNLIGAALIFLLLASTAGAFSSPINQEWFIRGRDRIWWLFKEQSDLQGLREAAQYVRENSLDGSTLLTQDTYLAVEANRNVPAGMEMGPFCYYPDMPREQAEKLHLLNRDMLQALLETSTAPLAAFSGYGLSIESPAVAPISAEDKERFIEPLTERFKFVQVFHNVGQAHTDLKCYRLKGAE